MKIINKRKTEYEIENIFLERYSPRAMSGEVVSKDELMTLFEAARWAPSANNIQPWRFLYAIRDTTDFELFFSFLKEGNQIWCKNAGALIIGLSKKNMNNGELNQTHSFDTGSAWENLALQGTKMGLIVHGMAGYKIESIKESLKITDEYQVELMITVGKPGKIEDLPINLQEREEPSQRMNLDTIIFEGKDGANKLLLK